MVGKLSTIPTAASRPLRLDALDGPVGVLCEPPGVARMNRLVSGPGPPAEAGSLVVREGALQFFARVHHEGSVLRDGLADWLALKEKDLGFGLAGVLFGTPWKSMRPSQLVLARVQRH